MICTVSRSAFNSVFSCCLQVALLLLLGAGCATKPVAPKKYYFYPPPPDEPRFQYLTGFSSAKQFYGDAGVKKFVLGRSSRDKVVGKPYGIGAVKDQFFYCDASVAGVGILKLSRKSMDFFVPERDGKMKSPINAAADAEGNLYVTDTEREQVLIYDKYGIPQEPIGKKDEMKPCGLAISGEKLYITDLDNHQVRIYRLKDRALLRMIPGQDDPGKGRLYSPVNVAVDQEGNVYVSDPGAFCVQVYDAEGKHLRTIGKQGTNPGQFARPRGVAVDREGRVYVVDAATQVVQLFDKEGRLLIYLGDPTISGPGSTHLPAGVAVDYENVDYFQKFCAPGQKLDYVLYITNQYGEPRISVYGFLKK